MPSLKVLAIAEAIYNLSDSDQQWLFKHRTPELRSIISHGHILVYIQILPMTSHQHCFTAFDFFTGGSQLEIANNIADRSFIFKHEQDSSQVCTCDACDLDVCLKHRISTFDRLLHEKYPTRELLVDFWMRRLKSGNLSKFLFGFQILIQNVRQVV